MDKRRLLEECADLFVICDDGTKIPCSRFHVSTQCSVLRWVTEDTSGRDIPFPGIPPQNLKLALDVVHDIASLDDYTLDQVEAAGRGFDVLGCSIDVSSRVWAIIEHWTIDSIRPRLSKLMRAQDVSRDTVIKRVVTLTPRFDDVMLSVCACQPDPEMGVYLAVALGKFLPIVPLVKYLVAIIPNISHAHILRIAGCDGIGTYIHPKEVSEIMTFVRDIIKPQSDTLHVWGFVRAMACALSTYDMAPLGCSSLHGSVIMFHDAPSTSVLLTLDGTSPVRRIVMTKWLKFSLRNRAVATIRAYPIDSASKRAKCMDVRMFVTATGQHAELWHSWTAPQWHPAMEVSTEECPAVTGDLAVFDAVVDSGIFARRMTIRVDIFYGATSVLDAPPLY